MCHWTSLAAPPQSDPSRSTSRRFMSVSETWMNDMLLKTGRHLRLHICLENTDHTSSWNYKSAIDGDVYCSDLKSEHIGHQDRQVISGHYECKAGQWPFSTLYAFSFSKWNYILLAQPGRQSGRQLFSKVIQHGAPWCSAATACTAVVHKVMNTRCRPNGA